MEPLVKGAKCPRVKAICTKCGVGFERSAVHPYIVDCPDCRTKVRKEVVSVKKAKTNLSKHLKCPICKILISTAGKAGMHRCEKCKDQWWSNGDEFWRRGDDECVFKGGEYVGNLRDSTFEEIYGLEPIKAADARVHYSS